MSHRTLVFVHAHPDDEALLTAGTMARAHAEGHRVVLIVATIGDGGLTSAKYAEGLSERRLAELAESARILGVDRVEVLGYPHSGIHGEIDHGFAHQDRLAAARRVAAIADEEQADVLVGYDPAGGYGHADHIQVHRVVRAAAVLAKKPPRLFEATLPREPIVRAVHAAAALRITPAEFDATEFDGSWTPRAQITHRVDVRRYLHQKRQSMRAHASQAAADGAMRTLGVLTKLPWPLNMALLGTEYYVAVLDPRAASTASGRSLAS